jgi:hypothetical protein
MPRAARHRVTSSASAKIGHNGRVRRAFVAGVVALLAAAGCSLSDVGSGSSGGSSGGPVEGNVAVGKPGSALALLAKVQVKGRAPKTGYDREEFGPAWADTDRNGCDTRNDILARDLTGETFRPGTHDCVVLTGRLDDPYTGRSITFAKAHANEIQIDHVVALSDAWQKGAGQWIDDRRVQFANDPLNLLAVSGPVNVSKSDSDAASWIPPNRSYRCAYVARQVAVKAKYGLWVTQPESAAIKRVLRGCPNQAAPKGGSPVR